MIEDIEYKVAPVKATSVATDDIDKTFRSSSIGKSVDEMIQTVCHRGLTSLPSRFDIRNFGR
jgi:hypothetical protein